MAQQDDGDAESIEGPSYCCLRCETLEPTFFCGFCGFDLVGTMLRDQETYQEGLIVTVL